MEHTTRSDRSEVVVVGAGLAGLVAATILARRGHEVVVVDPAPPGGRARTDLVDGFHWNRGPHAIYLGGEAARVLTHLGVALRGSTPESPSRGVRRSGSATMPAGPLGLFRTELLRPASRVRLAAMLASLARARRDPALATMTWNQWLADRHLADDASDLVDALARLASYVNAPDVVSADVMLHQLHLAVRHGVRYLDGGWQSIVDALASDVVLRPGTVRRVGPAGTGAVVELDDGSSIDARAVVLAGLSPEAAARVVGRAPFEAGPPAAAACLDLGVTGSAPRGASIGMDEPLYLSRHAPPAALAPAGHAVVHVARYLTPEDTADPAAARAELERFATRAGITDEMVVASRYLHRMTVVHAIPTPALGGLPGRPGVDATGVPGVFLAGDWVGPRGHLLDAALASARAAAEAASARLERSMMSVR